MRVKDYLEIIRYHAVVEFDYDGDPQDEDELRRALAKEILANDGLRRAEDEGSLFPGSLWQRAAKTAVIEVSDGAATATVDFEIEGFRCQVTHGTSATLTRRRSRRGKK